MVVVMWGSMSHVGVYMRVSFSSVSDYTHIALITELHATSSSSKTVPFCYSEADMFASYFHEMAARCVHYPPGVLSMLG